LSESSQMSFALFAVGAVVCTNTVARVIPVDAWRAVMSAAMAESAEARADDSVATMPSAYPFDAVIASDFFVSA
jgi:hypothetical protein